MTTLTLMQMVLRKLDRPIDNATVALYKDRLMGYFNEAVLDLTAEFRPWRRDELAVTNGQADLSALPRQCLKALTARIDKKRYLFHYGATRNILMFPGIQNGTAVITYRYQPAQLTELTDEPQLPKGLLGLLVEYAAARERSRFDAASQNAARLELTLYREMKGKLKRAYAEPEPSKLYHVY